MRTYTSVFDRLIGETRIIFRDDDDRGWTALDLNNPSTVKEIIEALNVRESRRNGGS